MNRLVTFFWILSILVSCTNASFKNEMFQTINRIGEEARQANTANLRRTIQETLSAGSTPEEWSCVRSQISASYKELHTSLNMVLDGLRTELRSDNPVLLSIPQEKVKDFIQQSVGEATAAFAGRLAQIKGCVPKQCH